MMRVRLARKLALRSRASNSKHHRLLILIFNAADDLINPLFKFINSIPLIYYNVLNRSIVFAFFKSLFLNHIY